MSGQENPAIPLAVTAATGTRQRLLDVAEFLFARSSFAAVTTREIVEVAGQRNVSSISYHFGSREGLLTELLARRSGPVDIERARLRSQLEANPDVRGLVDCLVLPQAELLLEPWGRSYIRIVAQLRGRYAFWRRDSDVQNLKHLLAILDEIEHASEADPAIQRERILAMIMLMTSSTAERARRIDESEDGGTAPELSHERYVEDLATICTAVITA